MSRRDDDGRVERDGREDVVVVVVVGREGVWGVGNGAEEARQPAAATVKERRRRERVREGRGHDLSVRFFAVCRANPCLVPASERSERASRHSTRPAPRSAALEPG